MTAQEKAESRQLIDRLHKKYYGNKKKKPATISEAAIINETHSRAQLMNEAKEKGIKNYRVLNKAELQEATAKDTTTERIQEIIKTAVARWKQGWGTKGPRKTK